VFGDASGESTALERNWSPSARTVVAAECGADKLLVAAVLGGTTLLAVCAAISGNEEDRTALDLAVFAAVTVAVDVARRYATCVTANSPFMFAMGALSTAE